MSRQIIFLWYGCKSFFTFDAFLRVDLVLMVAAVSNSRHKPTRNLDRSDLFETWCMQTVNSTCKTIHAWLPFLPISFGFNIYPYVFVSFQGAFCHQFPTAKHGSFFIFYASYVRVDHAHMIWGNLICLYIYW